IPQSELSAGDCELCRDPAGALTVTHGSGWQARVPWAPSWPYEMVLSPRVHVAALPAAGPRRRAGLGVILVDCLARLERLFGPGPPYLLWIAPGTTSGAHLAA